MTKTAPPPTEDHPPGASLHLGGHAWANPTLKPQLVDLDTLTPYPGNPRRGDQHAITSSIRDHGLYAGVLYQQSTRHILIGNHRRHGIAELGGTRIPAVPHDCNDITAAAIVARDNRTSDTGSYDPHDQASLLDGLAVAGVDLAGIGFAPADLLVLHRQVDAEDVFITDTSHMLDEFRAISGQDDTEYRREYVDKVAIYVRDAEAVADLIKRLELPEGEHLPARLNWPPGWRPYDRRQTWQAERDDG